MIGHQDIGGDAPAEALHRDAEEAEEREAVAIGAKGGTPLVATRGEVVEGAGELESKRSCHSVAEDPSVALKDEEWLPPVEKSPGSTLGMERRLPPGRVAAEE